MMQRAEASAHVEGAASGGERADLLHERGRGQLNTK
jgi:hypothetical protein